jgi:cobalt-zinc-cadmium efflux system outer membrane protein
MSLLLIGTWRSAHAQSVSASPNLPAVLTLEDALRIFHTHGLDLIMADAAVASAEGDVRVAGAIPNPGVAYSRLRVFTWRPFGFVADPETGALTDVLDTSCVQNRATCTKNGSGIDFNDQTALFDTLSGKRGLRLRVARAALAAARQGRVDAERNLDFLVKQQYIQASLARASLDFAIQVQESATKTFDLHHARYEKGAISEADEAKVEAEKLEADQAVATARQALDVAKLGLAALLGVRAQMPQFEVQQDLPKYSVPAPLASATRDSLLAEAFQQRPDLKAVAYQRDRAAAGIALAKLLRFPDIALDVNYAHIGAGGLGTNGPPMVPTLSVSASVTVPLFYRQQGEIRKAQADLKTQDAQRAKIEAQIIHDVGAAFTAFTASKERVERMETRLLERAKRTRDLVEIRYLGGAASLLEFLDAQRTYIATNLEYLDNLTAYWTAVFQIEQATGMELR